MEVYVARATLRLGIWSLISPGLGFDWGGPGFDRARPGFDLGGPRCRRRFLLLKSRSPYAAAGVFLHLKIIVANSTNAFEIDPKNFSSERAMTNLYCQVILCY